MKNRNFSSSDYDTAERERLEAIYSGTFPEDCKKITGKDIQNNSSEIVTITSIDTDKDDTTGVEAKSKERITSLNLKYLPV